MLLVLAETNQPVRLAELLGRPVDEWGVTYRARLTVVSSDVITCTLRQQRSNVSSIELPLPAREGVVLRDVLLCDFNEISLTGPVGTVVSVAVEEASYER